MGMQSMEDSKTTYWDDYQMIKTGDCLKEVTVGQMRRFFSGDTDLVTAEQGRVLASWADGLNRLEARYNEAAGPDWHATPFRSQTIGALTALLGIPPDVIATRRAEVLESLTETAHEMNALRRLHDMEHDLYRLIDRPGFMTNGLSGDLDWTKLFDSVIATVAIRSALEALKVAWWSPEVMVAVEGHVSSKLVALRVAERRNEADDIPGRGGSMSRPSRNDDPPDQPEKPDKNGEPKADIDALEIEPIRRQIGAGRSEKQWCRTQVNCRYIHGYTRFPSPYARLAGLDDTIEEHYSVYTGNLCRDDVADAEVRSDIEEDNVFFLLFKTLEEAVAFCLDDALAPMEIELYRRHRPISAP